MASTDASGFSNTAVGAHSLSNVQASYMNVAVGEGAGYHLTTGDHNIYIGNGQSGGIHVPSVESNTIRIGAVGGPRQHSRAFIAGVTTSNVPSGVPVVVDANGQLGTLSSSVRYKYEIADMGNVTVGIMRLRPVTFRYKQSNGRAGSIEYGLIAEEVANVYPDAVVYSSDGAPEAVQYHKINAMLLNEVQKQHREIKELRLRMARLESLLKQEEAFEARTGSAIQLK